MGIYSDAFAFVSDVGSSYIATYTKIVADQLEPAAVTVGGIYVIVWGIAHIRGAVQEPILEFAIRMTKLAMIIGVGIKLWQWDDLIVDTFIRSPDALTSAIAGAGSAAGAGSGDAPAMFNTFDSIYTRSFDIGNVFWKSAGILNGHIGPYLAAFMVWIAGIGVSAYGAFLVLLAKIFLYVLIAAGPVVFLGLFFEATSKYFESWIAQLSNYAIVPLLVTLANVFVIDMFDQVVTKTAALGGDVKITDCFPLGATALLSIMVLAQVSQVAASLAGGIALSSMGVGRRVFSGVLAPGKWAAKKSGTWAAKKAKEKAGERLGRAKDWIKARRNRVTREGQGTAGGAGNRQDLGKAMQDYRAKSAERKRSRAA